MINSRNLIYTNILDLTNYPSKKVFNFSNWLLYNGINDLEKG